SKGRNASATAPACAASSMALTLGPAGPRNQAPMLASVKGRAYHAPMELRQLRSFVAVAEELHFRRAADRLHLAQPSVSQQIRKLEAELGVPLFDRNRRGAALTPAGKVFLAEARDLRARAEHAAAVARATGSGRHGRLRMSLTRSLTGGIAGAIVDAYRARYPEGELVLGVGTTMLHAEQLHAGEIDVGFVRPPLEDSGLEELRLAREPMVCGLPRGPRLREGSAQ